MRTMSLLLLAAAVALSACGTDPTGPRRPTLRGEAVSKPCTVVVDENGNESCETPPEGSGPWLGCGYGSPPPEYDSGAPCNPTPPTDPYEQPKPLPPPTCFYDNSIEPDYYAPCPFK